MWYSWCAAFHEVSQLDIEKPIPSFALHFESFAKHFERNSAGFFSSQMQSFDNLHNSVCQSETKKRFAFADKNNK